MPSTLVAVPKTARNGSNPPRPPISTHLELVNPTQARDILDKEAYPHQRPQRPYQVQFLRQLMECTCNGRPVHSHFRAGTLISFARVGKYPQAPRYLINGQHTLAALGETTGGPLWLQVEEIVVPDLQTAGVLYETYDRNLARSWNDLYRADVSLQQYALVPKHLAKLGGAIRFLANGFQQAMHMQWRSWETLLKNTHIRFALMADWHQEMHHVVQGQSGPGSVRTMLQRAAVLSVALVTYRFQPEAAQRFWPAIAADSGLVAGQPTHTLLRFLRETPTRRLEPALYTRHVASAWNAFVQERPLKKLQPGPASQPLLLLGTPHDGTETKRYLTDEGTVVRQPQPARRAVPSTLHEKEQP
jgi:hypothetical protein